VRLVLRPRVCINRGDAETRSKAQIQPLKLNLANWPKPRAVNLGFPLIRNLCIGWLVFLCVYLRVLRGSAVNVCFEPG